MRSSRQWHKEAKMVARVSGLWFLMLTKLVREKTAHYWEEIRFTEMLGGRRGSGEKDEWWLQRWRVVEYWRYWEFLLSLKCLGIQYVKEIWGSIELLCNLSPLWLIMTFACRLWVIMYKNRFWWCPSKAMAKPSLMDWAWPDLHPSCGLLQAGPELWLCAKTRPTHY